MIFIISPSWTETVVSRRFHRSADFRVLCFRWVFSSKSTRRPSWHSRIRLVTYSSICSLIITHPIRLTLTPQIIYSFYCKKVSINSEWDERDLCGRNADSIFPLSREANLMLLDRHFYPKKQVQTSLTCCRNLLLRVVLRGEGRAGESERRLSKSQSENIRNFHPSEALVQASQCPLRAVNKCSSVDSPYRRLTKAGRQTQQERRTKLLGVVVRFLWTGGVSPNLGL